MSPLASSSIPPLLLELDLALEEGSALFFVLVSDDGVEPIDGVERLDDPESGRATARVPIAHFSEQYTFEAPLISGSDSDLGAIPVGANFATPVTLSRQLEPPEDGQPPESAPLATIRRTFVKDDVVTLVTWTQQSSIVELLSPVSKFSVENGPVTPPFQEGRFSQGPNCFRTEVLVEADPFRCESPGPFTIRFIGMVRSRVKHTECRDGRKIDIAFEGDRVKEVIMRATDTVTGECVAGKVVHPLTATGRANVMTPVGPGQYELLNTATFRGAVVRTGAGAPQPVPGATINVTLTFPGGLTQTRPATVDALGNFTIVATSELDGLFSIRINTIICRPAEGEEEGEEIPSDATASVFISS